VQIIYGSVTITDGDLLKGESPYRFDCSQVTSVLEGAADVVPLGRGGRRRRLPLVVPHLFDTLLEAEEFWLSHYDTLAAAGTLSVVCGLAPVTRTWTAAAVLESCGIRIEGALVLVEYAFLIEPFTLAA
jgi:hypothetical protein